MDTAMTMREVFRLADTPTICRVAGLARRLGLARSVGRNHLPQCTSTWRSELFVAIHIRERPDAFDTIYLK
jgi:hypothetical protein